MLRTYHGEVAKENFSNWLCSIHIANKLMQHVLHEQINEEKSVELMLSLLSSSAFYAKGRWLNILFIDFKL